MTIKTQTIRIPHRFYIDHVERGLPAPGVLKRTKSHLWIDALSRDIPELLDDAEHYANNIDARDFPELFGLVRSARATAKAIRDHMGREGAQ